ncbi:MAG: DUF1934 domain-containing protein [Paenisporosarcina sp.]
MSKQVKVKLKTTIQQPHEEPEIYELWSPGLLIEKGEHAYLKYEEFQDEKLIKTTLKMGLKEGLILRSGGVNMRLPFLLNADQTGNYESDFGTLIVKTKTRQMTFEMNEGQGQFLVQYELIVGGQPVGDYTLEFHYTEVSP